MRTFTEISLHSFYHHLSPSPSPSCCDFTSTCVTLLSYTSRRSNQEVSVWLSWNNSTTWFIILLLVAKETNLIKCLLLSVSVVKPFCNKTFHLWIIIPIFYTEKYNSYNVFVKIYKWKSWVQPVLLEYGFPPTSQPQSNVTSIWSHLYMVVFHFLWFSKWRPVQFDADRSRLCATSASLRSARYLFGRFERHHHGLLSAVHGGAFTVGTMKSVGSRHKANINWGVTCRHYTLTVSIMWMRCECYVRKLITCWSKVFGVWLQIFFRQC